LRRLPQSRPLVGRLFSIFGAHDDPPTPHYSA
jgi:hypothetical protein